MYTNPSLLSRVFSSRVYLLLLPRKRPCQMPIQSPHVEGIMGSYENQASAGAARAISSGDLRRANMCTCARPGTLWSLYLHLMKNKLPAFRLSAYTHRRIQEPSRLPFALDPSARNECLNLLPVLLHLTFLFIRAARRGDELVHRDAPIRECRQSLGQETRRRRRGVHAREAPKAILEQTRGELGLERRGKVGRDERHARPDEGVLDLRRHYIAVDCEWQSEGNAPGCDLPEYGQSFMAM